MRAVSDERNEAVTECVGGRNRPGHRNVLSSDNYSSKTKRELCLAFIAK
jgi:hypothetical protein